MAQIEIVGGPAHGSKIERPKALTLVVPVIGKGGFSQFAYTLRQCRNAKQEIVEVLAPAGREIDQAWLKSRGLTN